MENIDEQKLIDAVRGLAKSGKITEAIKKRDMGAAISSLEPEQSAEIKRILSDKAAMEKILSSSEAQSILRKLRKDGK